MPKLGQHFLKNQSALRLIAEALELKPGDTIIEIGPGHGELTEEIRGRAQRAKIIALEKDTALAGKLKERFKNEKNIEIIEGDALEILGHVPCPILHAPYKLAGNIPYYITGHLLRIISELGEKPERCVFTIQKEVAERIVAAPPRMNRLAASVQFWAEPKILETLPASDFSPPPEVESAIIQLVTHDKKPELEAAEKYYAAVRTIFAQPRKTVLNNLAANHSPLANNKEGLLKILQKVHAKPNARPQDLNIGDIEMIAGLLF
jgi:16S rRNA (adenine1518-N6/adenine1519-N6)-dimethyltransferase